MDSIKEYWPMIAYLITGSVAFIIWFIRLEGKVKNLEEKTNIVVKYGEKLEEIGNAITAIQVDFSWLKRLYLPTDSNK